MQTKQSVPTSSYDSVAKTLHWLVFVLIAIEFIIAWTMPGLRRAAAATALVSFHFSFGLLILAVIIIRIFWRFTHRIPEYDSELDAGDILLARVMHATLYGALLVMPFVGWMWASARGWQILFFGLFPVPPLVAVGSALGMSAGRVHSFLGVVLAVLIGLHALAALYHHYILKDSVLKRMLPDFDQ